MHRHLLDVDTVIDKIDDQVSDRPSPVVSGPRPSTAHILREYADSQRLVIGDLRHPDATEGFPRGPFDGLEDFEFVATSRSDPHPRDSAPRLMPRDTEFSLVEVDHHLG